MHSIGDSTVGFDRVQMLLVGVHRFLSTLYIRQSNIEKYKNEDAKIKTNTAMMPYKECNETVEL